MRKPNHTFMASILVLLISLSLLTACQSQPTQTNGVGQKTTLTAAVKTVQSQLTMAAAAIATATQTATPLPPIPTPTIPVPPTSTFISETTFPTVLYGSTLQATEKPQASLKGDNALMIERDPENGTTLPKDYRFDMVWHVKNTGTTTWNKNYSIIYYGGNRIGAGKPISYTLKTDVNPGQSYSIIVEMQTPNQSGQYKSIWFLMNEQKKPIYELNVFITVN